MPGQHNSLAWHWCPWLLWAFESILLWGPHRHLPWKSPLEHYPDNGMHHVLCSYVVGIEIFRFQWLFLWFGVSINSWIHSALFCTQGFEFALPMSNMLCWVTQTKPCLSMNQCCASQSTSANLLLYLRDMLSCQGPSHSFIISLIYLEPASLLITHHSSIEEEQYRW